MGEAYDKAVRAKEAARTMAHLGSGERAAALRTMAAALVEHTAQVCAANAADVEAARAAGIGEQLVDRLFLDEGRVRAMAAGLDEVAAQPDPLGRVLSGSRLPNGLTVEKVTVPLGVVAAVYEARPNVTADVAGLAVKTGNAVLLRGGSLAARSCAAIVDVLRGALEEQGLPADAVCLLQTSGHDVVQELFGLVGLVDVLIPRGGAGLIKTCVQNAKIPVIETGTGNCHVFVERSADLAMAVQILVNAKCSRPSVCNAAESLLVDQGLLDRDPAALPTLLAALADQGVQVHGDERTCAAAREAGLPCTPAVEDDWGREYLGLQMSCKVVAGLDEAVEHVNRWGTGHSECIVTNDYAASEEFLARVDAAAVYVNASTRFTDGGMFGLGAEVGISTQKLHARGPMGADALVTTKYLCRGNGQVR
jgi:glutamate-5-semialdehyde dehydrogenase